MIRSLGMVSMSYLPVARGVVSMENLVVPTLRIVPNVLTAAPKYACS